ncbi:MAG: DUF3553 domain-containing protein [Proteobacteria bacterium]|nr:DUF3553 domain-containing protein [Cystobacterineae bacterium]MCL2314089.1 DUF3553 domain-containing protein [Pseudomonadota bacterium]
MELAHTILAMVDLRIARVRCNTCQAQHSLRKNPRGGPSPSSSSASPPRKTASPSMASSVPLLLASADASKARNYSPRENFAEGDFLNHPSFGLGLVQAVRGDKMDVAFKAFEKTLIHGKIPPG